MNAGNSPYVESPSASQSGGDLSRQIGNDRPSIFGVDKAELLAGLESIRQRLCSYSWPGHPAETCDCKYGANGSGEQTGCPELREAMILVAQEFDKLTLTKELFEENATTALAQIGRIVDRHRTDLGTEVER